MFCRYIVVCALRFLIFANKIRIRVLFASRLRVSDFYRKIEFVKLKMRLWLMKGTRK